MPKHPHKMPLDPAGRFRALRERTARSDSPRDSNNQHADGGNAVSPVVAGLPVKQMDALSSNVIVKGYAWVNDAHDQTNGSSTAAASEAYFNTYQQEYIYVKPSVVAPESPIPPASLATLRVVSAVAGSFVPLWSNHHVTGGDLKNPACRACVDVTNEVRYI
jgi:hypothetical protein